MIKIRYRSKNVKFQGAAVSEYRKSILLVLLDCRATELYIKRIDAPVKSLTIYCKFLTTRRSRNEFLFLNIRTVPMFGLSHCHLSPSLPMTHLVGVKKKKGL